MGKEMILRKILLAPFSAMKHVGRGLAEAFTPPIDYSSEIQRLLLYKLLRQLQQEIGVPVGNFPALKSLPSLKNYPDLSIFSPSEEEDDY
ncbi:MAG: hypothetical protein ACUVQP_00040 [Bacteroidales bacterium]